LTVTRFLLFAVLFFLVGRALRRLFSGIVDGVAARPLPRSGPPDRGETMVRDPVCGTFVVPSRSLALKGKKTVHHFCSVKCRDAWKDQ
jgi:hypothetical protein